jgi:hypothetical protein
VADIPEPPSAARPLPSPASEDDEAAIRLLLDSLVSRLKKQPLQLAERALRREQARRKPGTQRLATSRFQC